MIPPPFGARSTIGEYPSPESVLIPQHIATPEVEVFMTVDAIRDLREPGGCVFAVHVEATRDGEARSALATGRDIYATTATILVECMERVLRAESPHGGVHAVGGLFDTRDLLDQLGRNEGVVTFKPSPRELLQRDSATKRTG